MDLRVPGLDPTNVVRALKQDPTIALIPIIVGSGMTMDSHLLKALEPGWIEDVWLKPIRMDRLLQRTNALPAVP